MAINQFNIVQTASWMYLPDTTTLIQYLPRRDLIELSKCSKRYRNNLEQQTLEKLDIYTWDCVNWEIYNKLRETCKFEKVLNYLETDLGNKLKFAKKFELYSEINLEFAKKFIRLLPNIKELIISIGCVQPDLLLCLKTILNGLVHLESVQFNDVWLKIDNNSTNNQIFPKSLKYLKITNGLGWFIDDGELSIYDTIDTSYINLHSITIISNRMLQNLSSTMQNLKEVEIEFHHDNDDDEYYDQLKFIEFLKANSQLKKLITHFAYYEEKTIKTILSFKYLEHWSINRGFLEGIEVKAFPFNYSIKYLKINTSMPAPLDLKLAKFCKFLDILDLTCLHLNALDLSGFKRKIDVLKLRYSIYYPIIIKEIDNSRIFKNVHIELDFHTKDNIDKDISLELNNYELIPLISGACILKLNNKTD